MTCRGAAQPGSRVTTLRFRGVFTKQAEKKADMRRDLVSLLAGPPNYSESE
jgi:GTP cyclohydrolase I